MTVLTSEARNLTESGFFIARAARVKMPRKKPYDNMSGNSPNAMRARVMAKIGETMLDCQDSMGVEVKAIFSNSYASAYDFSGEASLVAQCRNGEAIGFGGFDALDQF